MLAINKNNVVEKLLEQFPEYKASSKYFDKEEKQPYMVLSNLSMMAFDDLDEKGDKSIAEKLVKLTDQIANDSDSDDGLINMFQIEVFERLTGSRSGALLAKKFLHDKSLDLLEQTLKHYYTDEFLKEYRK